MYNYSHQTRQWLPAFCVALLLFFVSQPLWAHTVVATLQRQTAGATAFRYLCLGYSHILPFGIDHILFILSLCLLNPGLKSLLWQATAFTAAHTVTLGLSVYHVISPDPSLVEPVIAASIIYVAAENIFSQELKKARLGIVFLFGLIHGMGFAAALDEVGLPAGAYLRSLLLFNLGVELGQLTVIAAVYWLLIKGLKEKAFYRKAVVIPVSLLITIVAGYWLIERVADSRRAYQPICSAAADLKNAENPAAADSVKKGNQQEAEFWKQRIQPGQPGLTNEIKYAASLVNRYQLSGDINDLVTARRILQQSDSAYAHKETAPLLSLFRLAIMTHRFREADSLFTLALAAGLRPSEIPPLSFDINFEMGRMQLARLDLQKMGSPGEYGYCFRNARLLHYDGEIDQAIDAMKQALQLGRQNPLLQSAAASNLGDLYLHANDPVSALKTYWYALSVNPADWHSIMGLAWIAFIHDRNKELASGLLSYVQTQTQAPEPLLKQISIYLTSGDTAKAYQAAYRFAGQVAGAGYGGMYNKYLIRLYSGLLNNPARALQIARDEINNRPTPQTYAWYVHALAANGQKAEAMAVYTHNVAGKPLEALELFWMGNFLASMHDPDNANRYLRQAMKNRYELEPGW